MSDPPNTYHVIPMLPLYSPHSLTLSLPHSLTCACAADLCAHARAGGAGAGPLRVWSIQLREGAQDREGQCGRTGRPQGTALLHYCTTALLHSLYCTTVLYYTTVLHYCTTLLYSTALHCNVLLQYCNTLHCIVLHCAVLCYSHVLCCCHCVTVPLLCTHLSLLHYTTLH